MVEVREMLGFCRAYVRDELVITAIARCLVNKDNRHAVLTVFIRLHETESDSLRRMLTRLEAVPNYAQGLIATLLSEVIQFHDCEHFRNALRGTMPAGTTDGAILVKRFDDYIESEWGDVIGLA